MDPYLVGWWLNEIVQPIAIIGAVLVWIWERIYRRLTTMLAGILGRISGWKTAYDKQGTALAEALAKTETAESNLKTLDEPYRRLKVAHDDLAVRLSTAIGDRNAAVKSRNEARTERDEAFQQISDAIPEFSVEVDVSDEAEVEPVALTDGTEPTGEAEEEETPSQGPVPVHVPPTANAGPAPTTVV